MITLQWASVGEMRQNEAYAVTIIDATDSNKGKLVDYVTDTKFIVPAELRPSDGQHAHFPLVSPARPPDRHRPGQRPAHLGTRRRGQHRTRLRLDIRGYPTHPAAVIHLLF